MREFPEEAGYAIGGDIETKYYMIQMHYDNPRLKSSNMKSKNFIFDLMNFLDRHDSSGIRFYLGNELRKHDLGFLTLGTGASPLALAIPPTVDRFIVDSYCPSEATVVRTMKFKHEIIFSLIEPSKIRHYGYFCFTTYAFTRYGYQMMI
jgi:hypothetical protein